MIVRVLCFFFYTGAIAEGKLEVNWTHVALTVTAVGGIIYGITR